VSLRDAERRVRRRRVDVMQPKAGHPWTFDAAETLTVAGSVERGNQEN